MIFFEVLIILTVVLVLFTAYLFIRMRNQSQNELGRIAKVDRENVLVDQKENKKVNINMEIGFGSGLKFGFGFGLGLICAGLTLGLFSFLFFGASLLTFVTL